MRPPPYGRGHYKLPSVVCLSVRPSVCGVPRHNWRTERPRKPKFERMETHHTGNQWTYLEVKRSKVKVTRPINSHTVNVQYLPNGKAYERQIWYTDAARRHASATNAMTFKVNDQGRKFLSMRLVQLVNNIKVSSEKYLQKGSSRYYLYLVSSRYF